MKRPDPITETSHRYPAPVIAEEHSINSLPLDVIKYICGFLGPKDMWSILQARKYYYSVRGDEAFLQRFFNRCYFSPSPKKPEQSWLGACERADRMISNIAAGRCRIETTPLDGNLDGDPSLFTRDDQGRFIIAYSDGSVKVFDPKTKDSVTLEEPNGLYAEKIVYEAGLCAVSWGKKICAWELVTPPKKIFNWENNKRINTEIKLIEGRLLIQRTHSTWPFLHIKSPFVIQVINLKSGHKSVFPSEPLVRPINTTIFGDMLFVIYTSAPAGVPDIPHFKCKISIINLNTNECFFTVPIELPQYFSNSLEVCHSPEFGLFFFNSDSDIIHKFDLKSGRDDKRFSLWKDPGIPDGFCYWGEDSKSPYSIHIKALSFLFHKCLVEQFLYWGNLNRSIKNFLPSVPFYYRSGIFHEGKLFCFNKNSKEIHCLDFTASIRDVLEWIVEQLEAKDKPPVKDENEVSSVESSEDEEDRTPFSYALRFLDRMPKPVRDAIWSIHDDNLPKDWKEKGVDQEYLKDSILAYLESTKGE
jgi:hypothetical protein